MTVARTPAGEQARRADERGSRNRFTGARDRAFRLWVGSVTACGLGVLVLAVLALDLHGLRAAGAAFWLVCGLLLLTELRPLFGVGERDAQGLLISPAVVFAVMLGHGPAVAVVLQALATALVDLSQRKALWRTGFNVAQYALSWAAAGTVLWASGHLSALGHPHPLHAGDLLPALVAALAYFAVNQALVAIAVALKTGSGPWELLRADLPWEALSNGALLGMAPIIALAMAQGPAFVPLLLPPLLGVFWVARVAGERERQARTDPLTGLANRTGLREAVERALAEGEPAALLLFDLDRFKDVNDTLGHSTGDALLCVVAQRLGDAVRPGDTVARLGGDEFAVLLAPVAHPSAGLEVARRLQASLAAPVVLDGLLVDVGASTGVALAPEHGGDVDALLQRADVAMYQAKASGQGVCVYDPSTDSNSTDRLVLLGELRQAIGQGQLVVHFQTQARLADGAVTGVEALVRWQHPERGTVPPDQFVPLAERSGLVQLLTRYVLERACAQVAQWRAQGLDLTVAVNVSVRDLCGGVLPEEVAGALARHGLPPSALVLEVTEGMLFADPVRATATLERLAASGVALSLDDFGTGWSSFSHLRTLPVQEVKVDRSFVRTMLEDARDEAVVRSVVDLARGLGLSVVAEGVEDEATWQRLCELGATAVQGWHLSRPQPAEQLTPWLLARAAAGLVPGPRAVAEGLSALPG